jgi:16S rRNA (uracil1498-N3)-methyltransferase
MLPRFFVDGAPTVGEAFRLPDDAAHHALRVLRLRDGAPIVLFNGRGGEFSAGLRTVADRAFADIEAFAPVERESPLKLTLLQSLVAAEKLDWIVEKAVELGVEAIAVAPARRSVVRLDAARAARRLEHWRGVAQAACCQCGRNRVPPIRFHQTLGASLAAAPVDASRLVLLPDATSPLPTLVPDRGAVLLVGPEGGLAEDERALAIRTGFVPTRLGPRILRTETAGVAALAALQALGGDLAASQASGCSTRGG